MTWQLIVLAALVLALYLTTVLGWAWVFSHDLADEGEPVEKRE